MARFIKVDYFDPSLIEVKWTSGNVRKICSLTKFRKLLRKNCWFPIDVSTRYGVAEYHYDGTSEKMIDVWHKIKEHQELQDNIGLFHGYRFEEISSDLWSFNMANCMYKRHTLQFTINDRYLINSIGDKNNKIISDGKSFTSALDSLQGALNCHFDTKYDKAIYLHKI